MGKGPIVHKDIIFTNTTDFDFLEKPVLAKSLVPDWYKDTKSYINGEKKPALNGEVQPTIKRCMPVFDAISSGYIIKTHSDIYTDKYGGIRQYQWTGLDLLHHHPIDQAPLHPLRTETDIRFPKFINPWSIKTPKGYSCLFVKPMHRDLPFDVFPGIVDTDKYTAPVNIIFSITDPDFEGFIPVGTPIVQVIPFKRDNWSMGFGGEKEKKETRDIRNELDSRFFDKYKNMFRADRSFK